MGQTIQLSSTNIRYDNPADGPHAWLHRLPVLLNCIEKNCPDFLGTQEGREPQLRELELALSGYFIQDSHRKWIGERMYPTIFIRREFLDFFHLEVAGSGDIWLSETPTEPGSKSFGSAFPRICTWVRISNARTSFLIANAHLDHTKESVRERQAQVLATEVSKILNDNEPLILLGDFNTDPFSRTRELIATLPVTRQVAKNLVSKRLIDPWQTLGLKEEATVHNFSGAPHPEGSRIDWILISDSLTPISAYVDQSNQGGVYPSDHFPIFLKLKLN